MPIYALLILLFWNVIVLKYPAFPKVVPSLSTTAVLVLTPFVITQFLTVTLVMDVVPVEPTARTIGDVVFVFFIGTP